MPLKQIQPKKRILNGRFIFVSFGFLRALSFSLSLKCFKMINFHAIVMHPRRFSIQTSSNIDSYFYFSIFTIDLIFGQCSYALCPRLRSSFAQYFPPPPFALLSLCSFFSLSFKCAMKTFARLLHRKRAMEFQSAVWTFIFSPSI